MYALILINFMVPFLILMTRGAKRHLTTICIASVIVIFGHWLDFFQMSVPGAVANMIDVHAAHDVAHAAADHGAHGHDAVHAASPYYSVGLYELGLGLMYAGLFSFVLLRSLASAPLVPKNHPFIKESATYHT
jgi:hypothetical protein